MAGQSMELDIKSTESFKVNGNLPRTSSFQDRINQNGMDTPVAREIENAMNNKNNSPRHGRRATSPEKTYSPTYRSTSNSPLRRQRSFLRSTSPDKLGFRRSEIWAQWEKSQNTGQDYLQVYNVRQMTDLYGKELGGKVEAASEWYRNNGLDRSKTQMEALHWLSESAVTAATAPVSCTPRATQTSPDIFSKTPMSSAGTPASSMGGHMKFVGSPYKNREMKTRESLKDEKNLNKLSTRHRVTKTPGVDEIRARETKFTNDAIVTERRRTRFKDIIPQYDASIDRHCKAYFKRNDVQKLIGVTRSRDVTPGGSVTPGTVRSTPRQTPGATPF